MEHFNKELDNVVEDLNDENDTEQEASYRWHI